MLWSFIFALGISAYANAASYSIKFTNNTPYDVKFYELTIPSSQATPQNFSNYITTGTSVKTVTDNTSYTFTTKSTTKSIYMVIVQIAQSLIKPIKFDVNASNSETLTMTSSIVNPYIIISIKKGTTVIVNESYLKQLTM
jgi:hypothetical protein